MKIQNLIQTLTCQRTFFKELKFPKRPEKWTGDWTLGLLIDTDHRPWTLHRKTHVGSSETSQRAQSLLESSYYFTFQNIYQIPPQQYHSQYAIPLKFYHISPWILSQRSTRWPCNFMGFCIASAVFLGSLQPSWHTYTSMQNSQFAFPTIVDLTHYFHCQGWMLFFLSFSSSNWNHTKSAGL